MEPELPVVAVFNTSPDTIDLLRFVLEKAGLVVVTAFTFDLRDTKVNLESFVRQHRPKVVVYDVAPPYAENWRLFQHIRQSPALAGMKYVITTTNPIHVGKLAGEETPLYEIIGKPYDLGLVVQAVREALQ